MSRKKVEVIYKRKRHLQSHCEMRGLDYKCRLRIYGGRSTWCEVPRRIKPDELWGREWIQVNATLQYGVRGARAAASKKVLVSRV